MTSKAAERLKFVVLHSRKKPGETVYVSKHLFEAYRIEEAERREKRHGRPSDIFDALIARAFNVLGVWVKPRFET